MPQLSWVPLRAPRPQYLRALRLQPARTFSASASGAGPEPRDASWSARKNKPQDPNEELRRVGGAIESFIELSSEWY